MSRDGSDTSPSSAWPLFGRSGCRFELAIEKTEAPARSAGASLVILEQRLGPVRLSSVSRAHRLGRLGTPIGTLAIPPPLEREHADTRDRCVTKFRAAEHPLLGAAAGSATSKHVMPPVRRCRFWRTAPYSRKRGRGLSM